MKRFFLIIALLSVLPLAAQTTVTLNGVGYTTTASPVFFGGPSGTLAVSLQDTSSTGKANAANLTYPYITNFSSTFISSGYNWTGSLSVAANPNNLSEYAGGTCPNAALAWWAQGGPSQSPIDPNGYLALAKRCIDHMEEYADGAMGGCDVTQADCGRAGSWDADWEGAFAVKMAITYDIIHDQLTSGEISTFANKILNDNTAANGGIDTVACTPQPQSTSFTATISGTTMTVSAVAYGTLAVGQLIYYSAGSTATVSITALGTGTGGAGTYTISSPLTVSSATVMTALELGTISASSSSPTITGTGTNFSGYAVGGVLIMSTLTNTGAPSVLGFISSVGSGTSLTLTSNSSASYTGNFYYMPPWNNNCGLIWYLKHIGMAPALTTNQPTYYNAGLPGTTSSSGPLSNLTWPQTVTYFGFAMVLAADDSRAQTLATQAYNYYLTQEHNFALTSYSGFPEEGASYPHGRQATSTTLLLLILQNALVSPPNIAGTLTKRWAQEFYLAPLPYSLVNQESYGSTAGDRYAELSQGPATFGAEASSFLGTSAEGEYLNYFLFSSEANGGRGDWNTGGGIGGGRGDYITFPFIYAPSPAKTSIQTDYRTLPTQFIFTQNDTATCTSLGLTCNLAPLIYQNMISKSDWTSTATEVITNAGWYELGFDHMGTINPGNIHIYRGAPLLAGDGGCNDSTNSDTCDMGDSLGDSVLTLNAISNYGTSNYPSSGSVGGFPGFSGQTSLGPGEPTNLANYSPVTRWGGTVPTGDASSRYAYEMIDQTQAYLSSIGAPTRVQRHVIHFKKSGTQDYVVQYDDLATSSGNLKTAFFHYFVDCASGGSPCNATISDGTKAITLTRGSTSRLVTNFLSIAGSNQIVMTDEGTLYPGHSTYYPGPQPTYNTDRVNICGSSNGSTCDSTLTAAEFLTVHLPSLNTVATMPTLTQPTCTGTGGNCAVVQIGDASYPKVAVFARQGVLLTGTSFTTTHSGTAQYLIAGLDSAHTYNVTVNSSTVLSGATVNANDNTLYFESTDGAVVISASGVTNYTLTVSTAGSGSGSISGTNCSTSSYASGTTIGACTATPSGGSTFAGWSGTLGCTGTSTCTQTITANSTMIATFNTSSASPVGASGITLTGVSVQ